MDYKEIIKKERKFKRDFEKLAKKRVRYLSKIQMGENKFHPISNLHGKKGFFMAKNLESSNLAYLLYCKWGTVIIKWDIDKDEWVPVNWNLQYEPKYLVFHENVWKLNVNVWKLNVFLRKTTLFHRIPLNDWEDDKVVREVDNLILKSQRNLEDEMKKFNLMCHNFNNVSEVLSKHFPFLPDVDEHELNELNELFDVEL